MDWLNYYAFGAHLPRQTVTIIFFLFQTWKIFTLTRRHPNCGDINTTQHAILGLDMARILLTTSVTT